MPLASSIPSVSVVVPTYKEAENLPLLVPQIAAALSSQGRDWEIIIVDDNSPDHTKQTLDQLSAKFGTLRYLIRTKERGLSSAVLAGVELAVNEIVVVMDADLSHPPEAIPAMVEKLANDEADFVIGSRYVAGGRTEDWSRLRQLNSSGATLLAKPLVGTIKDPMAGFFAFRREALRDADALNPIGYKIGLELIAKMHVTPERVAEVPITFRNRVHGESKLTMKEQFKYLEHLSRLYDYCYPKGSPRAKFLIAAGCGAAACVGVVAMMNGAAMPAPLSIAAGLVTMIGITLAFFVRYVRTQRAFLLMKRPFTEFGVISVGEFIAGWGFAVSTPANLMFQMIVGICALLIMRYTLRKVFLHDLRGIRGTPTERATRRVVLAPRATAA